MCVNGDKFEFSRSDLIFFVGINVFDYNRDINGDRRGTDGGDFCIDSENITVVNRFEKLIRETVTVTAGDLMMSSTAMLAALSIFDMTQPPKAVPPGFKSVG